MKIVYLVLTALLLLGVECSSNEVCDPGETQTCVCVTGDVGSQSCNSSGDRWGGCACGTTSPDAGAPPPRSCARAGQVILNCGCWGPAYEGQVRTAAGCCSGRAYSTAVGCAGYCSAGGYPWGNICL